MVKIYDYNDVEPYEALERQEKFYNKFKKTPTKQEKGTREYLNIWYTNPSFKDVLKGRSIPQSVFLFGIVLGMTISMYLLSYNLILSVGVGVLFCIVFVFIFHDEIYALRYTFLFFTRKKTLFNPLEDFIFWYKEEDTATLYMSNRNDSVHVALRVYQIKIIPENIKPATYNFIKALASSDIRLPYSYQVVQKPMIELFNKSKSREDKLKSLQSRAGSIYFSVFAEQRGKLTDHKIDRMQFDINLNSSTLKSNIVSNFHHFQAVLLRGNALMNAIRTFYLKEKVSTFKNPIEKRKALNSQNSYTFWKFGVCVGLLMYVSTILLYINFFFLYIIGINLGLIIGVVLLWWRSLIFQFTKSKLIHSEDIIIAKPYENIRYYRVKEFPYSLFLHVENRLVIGMKLANLKYASQNCFCDLERVFESLNNGQVNFCYTVKNSPLTFSEFYYHEGFKHLYDHIQRKINWKISTEADQERWLQMRAGMWATMVTMSVSSYRFVNTLNYGIFDEIENELISHLNIFQGAFHINSQALKLDVLKANSVISGYLLSALKHNLFRLNGTHLNYLMFQGSEIRSLNEIVNVLKKAVNIEIAAEFNTPLYLNNYITVGHTFNTEVFEMEVPFGFTKNQLRHLLLINGTPDQRDLIAMKIVLALIKARDPSIVFDFEGKWSKLLCYFKESEYQKDILYFKYGSSFVVDPIKSDIPYDEQNAEYLEYIYDAFGVALKKDERTVEMFRQTIQKNHDMDLGAIQMALQNQTEWEKTPVNDQLLQIFADFTTNEMTYFHAIHKESIISNDFVRNDKTIIIDLSVFRDLKKKLFVSFVILSKIIHYIQHSDNYHKKFVYIPYIDIFFESYFLDSRRIYDTVDIFFKPLIDKKFGLICSAHQIHYLHANALLYFTNYLTLRTTNIRDISVLKNILNLQELEGTGIYSEKRKHSHQIVYLRNLKENKVITRRDDIDQPFPALIEWEEIQDCPTLPYTEIVNFMDTQGFDLHASERKILEQARETIFEIDLGHYYVYIKDIIKFIDYLLTIDQIGNLYLEKLKTHLKEYLYSTISEKTQNKQHIKKIIENVIDTLIKHEYLVENHPHRAGGGEALRTSYSVGPRYQEALMDYYKVEGRKNRDYHMEVLERESIDSEDLSVIFSEYPRKYIVQKDNLKEAIIREAHDLYYNIFKSYSCIQNGEYSNAIKILHELIKTFLMHIYRHFYNVDTVVQQGFNSFLTVLEKVEGFPYSKQELIELIDRYQYINIDDPNINDIVKDMYQSNYRFFNNLQKFLVE